MDKYTELLRLDTQVYRQEVLERTLYDMFPGTVTMRREKTCTVLESDDPHLCASFPQEEFMAAVLDHHIRLRLEESVGPIRDLIVARALYPDGNIEEVATSLLAQELR